MELFSQKFLSIYFIFLIVWSVLWMAIKIFKNLAIDKTIKTLVQLPEDRKEKISRLYGRIILMYKIYLWIAPFGFLMVLAAYLLLSVFPELTVGWNFDIRQFLTMAGFLLVITYVHFIEDSLYRRKILKAIDNR